MDKQSIVKITSFFIVGRVTIGLMIDCYMFGFANRKNRKYYIPYFTIILSTLPFSIPPIAFYLLGRYFATHSKENPIEDHFLSE